MQFFRYHKKSLVVLFLTVALGVFAVFCSIDAYPEVFRTEVSMEKAEDISLSESLVLNFSVAPIPSYYQGEIVISSKEDFELRWENANTRLTIIPKSFWQPSSQYEIIFPRGRNKMFFPLASQKFSFETEDYPEVLSVIPSAGAQGVVLDIEDPIIINFKKSTANFYLKFSLDPEEDLSVQNNPEKTEFRLLPKKEAAYSTKYKLSISAKYFKDEKDGYKKIHESFFETAAPPKISWDKNHSVRLEQAKKYTTARIREGRYVDINLSSQVMSIFENGQILDAFMVSSGKRGMDTPKGQTQIYNKFPRAYSRAYGLYMPYWMAISPDGKFGLHELPEWPNGYKEGASHLGTPVSHGCVRLGVGAAKKVYDWVEVGTPVVIY